MCNTVYFILFFLKKKKKRKIKIKLLLIRSFQSQRRPSGRPPSHAREFRVHVFDVDVCIRWSGAADMQSHAHKIRSSPFLSFKRRPLAESEWLP